MTLWITIIGAVLQIVLLTLQKWYSNKADVKQAHADNRKEIMDAISSRDVSRINSVINGLRR